MQNQLLDIPQENKLTRKLRRTLAWNLVTTIVHQSRFRFVLVLALSTIFWAAVFYLFYDAFTFIDLCVDGNDDFFNWNLNVRRFVPVWRVVFSLNVPPAC